MIRHITTEETLSIRKSILRNNKEGTCIFDGDNKATSFHLGAFNDKKLVGIATFMKAPFTFLEGKQYQLRGMATLQEVRGLGFGKELISEGCKILRDKKIDFLWCNAREVAIPFYKKLLFKSYGDFFEIPEIGPHIKMFKKL